MTRGISSSFVIGNRTAIGESHSARLWVLRFVALFFACGALLSFSPESRADKIPPGVYRGTCSSLKMLNPAPKKDPSGAATRLTASCTDFFGNPHETSLDDADSCHTDIGIQNVNGSLRCVISQVPISSQFNSAPYDFFNVISVVSDTITEKSEVKVWRIDQPMVVLPQVVIPQIKMLAGDKLSFRAGGCAQSGGFGKTWKNFLNPYNPDLVNLYFGKVQVMNAPDGLGVLQRLSIFMPPDQKEWSVGDKPGSLIIGYQDQPGDYGDNGYWGHDDGDNNQCVADLPNEAGGPAWMEITITRTFEFKLTDVAPNYSFGHAATSVDPAGRVLSLVSEAAADGKTILYAAAEFSGIWKSEDGGKSWKYSSVGLKSGLTQNHTSLAIDPRGKSSESGGTTRLLYATGDDDGRPNNPYGGLWVSDDAAKNWHHTDAGHGLKCAASPPLQAHELSISSVAFSSGQPFVATRCGIFTTADSGLQSAKWTLLPQETFGGANAILSSSGGNDQTLFACSGTQIWRSTDLGSSWETPLNLGVNTCAGISAVPRATGEKRPSSAAVVYLGPGIVAEVAIYTFGNPSATPAVLNLSAQAVKGGSGQPNVYTPRVGGSTKVESAGINYDVYAADACVWWVYTVGATGTAATWNRLGGGTGQGCSTSASGVHVDTWDMTFPADYDPDKGICTALASTDGGVFINDTKAKRGGTNCNRSNGWKAAQSGLHAMETTVISGFGGKDLKDLKATEVAKAKSPLLFVPSGDNDTWAATTGLDDWQPLNDALGDAGESWLDPLKPNRVLASRNNVYSVKSPPQPKGPPNVITTGPSEDLEIETPGNGDLTQVMTPAGQKPLKNAEYISVESGPTVDPTHDRVVRNTSVTFKPPPPSAGTWTLLENVPAGQLFPLKGLVEIQAAQGTARGGSVCSPTAGGKEQQGLVVYALTNNGQIKRGEAIPVIIGKIKNWQSADAGLKFPVNIIVNPYDPSEIYAVDLLAFNSAANYPSKMAIFSSHNCGKSWELEKDLTERASEGGEFRTDCNYVGNTESLGRGGGYVVGTSSKFFTHACMLGNMAFDVHHPEIRVAVVYPGGLMFSRDSGKSGSWIHLDVNDVSRDELPLLPQNAFYDSQTDPEVPTIYFTAQGRSVWSLSGPFPEIKGSPAIK
jgi:hypothetical protein